VISVSESTLKLAAGVEPKVTAVVPFRFLPLIVTSVVPVTGPNAGKTVLISGGGWISALSEISFPSNVSLGAWTEPSNGVGKIDA
jgi:hypothetical protein